MPKVILVDNYDREEVADILLEENLSREVAEEKANKYNRENEGSCWYARAVSDDYRLWGGIAELV